MAKAAKPESGLDFLLAPSTDRLRSLCVVAGDEPFIKREVLTTLRHEILGDGDAELSWHVMAGKEAEWADVSDAVSSRSLFGDGDPVALIEEADTFVTQHRDQLERHVEKGVGLVILEVKTMPTNTRLAKAVLAHGRYLRCSTPDRGAELGKYKRDVIRWLQQRAKQVHATELKSDAADRLLDLLPLQLGLLDQEVARLGLLADQSGITTELVTNQVGGWRVRTAWEMIDAVVEGRAADAIGQLDRLLIAGEQPIGVLAQLGSTLRKFAAAATAIEVAEQSGGRASLSSALAKAGMPKFKLGDCERQLRQLGRVRARELAQGVLESDLALKGHNSSPQRARVELERLIVHLSKEAIPQIMAK